MKAKLCENLLREPSPPSFHWPHSTALSPGDFLEFLFEQVDLTKQGISPLLLGQTLHLHVSHAAVSRHQALDDLQSLRSEVQASIHVAETIFNAEQRTRERWEEEEERGVDGDTHKCRKLNAVKNFFKSVLIIVIMVIG